MPLALAIMCSLAGLLATVSLAVLLLASMPNSTPARLVETRWWMAAVASVGLGGLIGAVWALAADRPWIAAGIGLGPVAFSISVFVYLLCTGK